jgi:hypothetical protein
VASTGDASRLRPHKSDWQTRLPALGGAAGRLLDPV